MSLDGRMLCGCAEYWLPDGVNSAMELIEKKDELAWIEEERKDMKNTKRMESNVLEKCRFTRTE